MGQTICGHNHEVYSFFVPDSTTAYAVTERAINCNEVFRLPDAADAAQLPEVSESYKLYLLPAES